MKYSITVKFVAIFLAALALVAAAGSAFGVAVLTSMNQYAVDFDTWCEQTCQSRAQTVADWVCRRYAAETFSDLSQGQLDLLGTFRDSDLDISQRLGLQEECWSYRICDETGTQLQQSKIQLSNPAFFYTETQQSEYPCVSDGQGVVTLYDENDTPINVEYAHTPEYSVTVEMTADALQSYNGVSIAFLEMFFAMRYGFIVVLVVSLVLFAVCAVYLCCAAGRSPKEDAPSPGGLNKLSLDLYLALAGTACVLLVMLALELLESWFYDNGAYNLGILALTAVILMLAAVIGIGFFFAVAAQFKMPGFYWWHHSAIGWCCDRIWRGIRLGARIVLRLVNMLPAIWKYLLIGSAMVFFPLLFLLLACNGADGWLIFLLIALLADAAVICYGAYAYGTLLRGAKRMAEGTLNMKISTKYLVGTYKNCALHLNDLADAAMVAAQQQMRSERMKTELITNVSHDIKTPLTSIINYVDLLEKPHSQEEQLQYLEVLGRQSQRLKKLIEDLMEMSKATTGNMAVEIGTLDGGEAVNQALGEFADKLEKAQLIPVFCPPEEPMTMQADGRLTWRVLSNLLSNIVKYALPGTRVYIDITQAQDCVLISLKNISREALNISADELTERFVRGDLSRNTEGSGLGLNIAKSLMELQKGQLQLLVDGDLFKVTLVFPKA